MFVACGCTNVTPISKNKLSVEFWSKAVDPRADEELLKNLHINNNLSMPAPNLQDTTLWDIFRDAMLSNKKGLDSIIRILSIIAYF